MEILTVKDLSFTYKNAADPALENVSFSVEAGQFVTICGPTGGGKSTLLRLIKRELSPAGTLKGTVLFDGVPLSSLTDRQSAERIGCVVQRPEEQIVSDRVGGELFFGAESLGYSREKAFRRVAEISDLFGFSDLFGKRTDELSGGQKQLLALASALVTSPGLLLLDEPTSRLDPVASADFISMLHRINEELGVTVMIAEHSTSGLLRYSDRLMFIEDGRMTAFGAPRDVLSLKPSEKVLPDMPAPVREHWKNGGKGECPLTVKEGRGLFTYDSRDKAPVKEYGDPALECSGLYFRYGRGSQDILKGVDLTVREGEIRFIFGGNGCGKTTLLNCAAGIERPYSGSVRVFGRKLSSYKNGELYSGNLSMLCQDAVSVFTHDTVGESFKGADLSSLPYDISGLLPRHPYDLSGGELQIAALCRVLVTSPRLLLLDEPTKGMDAAAKEVFANVLRGLAGKGVAVVTVSHDTELAAMCADTCSMMFSGGIVCTGDVRDFMRGNAFYTTDLCRMSGGAVI